MIAIAPACTLLHFLRCCIPDHLTHFAAPATTGLSTHSSALLNALCSSTLSHAFQHGSHPLISCSFRVTLLRPIELEGRTRVVIMPGPVKCTYLECRHTFPTEKEMKAHKKADHEYCRRCDYDAEDWDDHLPTKSIPWHLMSLGTEDTIKSKNLDTLSANSVVKNSRASVVVTSTAHGSVPSSS